MQITRSILIAALAVLAPAAAHAGALITRGQTQIFVEDYGAISLFTGAGLPVLGSRDGWGVAVNAPGLAEATAVWPFGTTNLPGFGAFGSTATTATSSVAMGGAPIQIRHAFGPSADADTFLVEVRLLNFTLAPVTGVEYRRAISWSVPTGSGVVSLTHGGIGAPNLAPPGNIQNAGIYDGQMLNPVSVPVIGPFNNTNFADVNVTGSSRGSYFDLEFPTFLTGSRFFNMFYGSKPTETAALAAISALGIQAYSLAQSPAANGPGDPTYFFGLYGIDGTVPGSTPAIPILPFVPSPISFLFLNPPQAAWYDPPAASGFRYEIDGATFTTVGAPPASFGFGPVDIYDGATLLGSLAPGGTFDLTPYNLSVFELRGISPLLDLADPATSRAFPTFLDFTEGATELRMTALVPAPAALALFGLGALALIARRRR